MNLPEIPQELRRTLDIYADELRADLEIFKGTFRLPSFDVSSVKGRFHRIKGAAGFFRFDDAANLAKEAESSISESVDQLKVMQKLQTICQQLEEHLKEVDNLRKTFKN